MKRPFALLSMLLLAALTSCSSPQDGTTPYAAKVYFLTTPEAGRGGEHLSYEYRRVDNPGSSEALRQLIANMYTPRNAGNRSVIPSEVKLQSLTRFSTVAIVDFSSEYRALSPLEQSLLSGGVAMTLLGQEGVSYVRITSDGEAQPPMGNKYYSLEQIMLTNDAVSLNAYDVTLYFLTDGGTGLSAVQRTIKTADEYPAPETLLEQLLTPPSEGDLRAPLPNENAVNFCQMEEDGLCHIDLAQVTPGALGVVQLHALVNTVMGDSSVQGVVITVGGQPPSALGVPDCDGVLGFSRAYGR